MEKDVRRLVVDAIVIREESNGSLLFIGELADLSLNSTGNGKWDDVNTDKLIL